MNAVGVDVGGTKIAAGVVSPEVELLNEVIYHDLEVHVGLEQREPHLAHGLVDVVLGERAAAADVGERLLEAF